MHIEATAFKDQVFSRAGGSVTPSVIAGWDFLDVREADAEDALPIQVLATEQGPEIVYDPELCPLSLIENPVSAMMWLPMAINHLAHSLLQEATRAEDGIGRMLSERWNGFRHHASVSMSMSWNEIVNAARLDGIQATAEYMTSAIFVEGGIQSSLARRMSGAPALRVV